MTQMIINITIGSIVTIIIGVLAYSLLAFAFKNKKLSEELVQTRLDKIALLNKLNAEIEARESKTVESTDGFIRFLSDSRDWAFKYIEDVQQLIVNVKNAWDNGEQLEDSIKKLFEQLPENTNKSEIQTNNEEK